MIDSPPEFFITGGTLPLGARSYVERAADRELFDALRRGEFCYVLTSRQMGKSSLMVRTARRLKDAGLRTVVIDLTAIGQNLTPSQWYRGMLCLIGQQLGIEDALELEWRALAELGPVQRLMETLRRTVLLPFHPPVILFLDEIDVVRSLPFPTDELFAGIRECFNRRILYPEFRMLTFCLLGVAAPSDLIRDVRTTPFNIGRRVELHDFSAEETTSLRKGLLAGRRAASPGAEREAQPLIDRIFYWSGGQPYLTQRLCQALWAEPGAIRVYEVDQACKACFLSPTARERDDNLIFVRERLLRAGGDLVGLLDLYDQVLRGKRVPDDEADPLKTVMRLSGVVAPRKGRLQVRNRIYAHVFDRDWVNLQMPDAELRRQRRAFYQGVLRTSAATGIIVAVVGGLSLSAEHSARVATGAENRARQLAAERGAALADARQLLYVSRMQQVQHAIRMGNYARASMLLQEEVPKPGEEDLRGWEWRYYWQLCHRDVATFNEHNAPVSYLRFLNGDRVLAEGTSDGAVILRDLTARRILSRLPSDHTRDSCRPIVSPDGKWVARVVYVRRPDAPRPARDIRISLVELSTQAETLLPFQNEKLLHYCFSPDSRSLALLTRTKNSGARIRVWATAKPDTPRMLHLDGAVRLFAFSPDGTILAFGCEDGRIELRSATDWTKLGSFRAAGRGIHSLEFSGNGEQLAVGLTSGAVYLYAVRSGQQVSAFPHLTGSLRLVALSAERGVLIAGTRAPGNFTSPGDTRVWDTSTRREVTRLEGHSGAVLAAAVSRNGRLSATGGFDGLVKLWDLNPHPGLTSFRAHPGPVLSAAISADGSLLATRSDRDGARIWSIPAMREVGHVSSPQFGQLAFSSRGVLGLVSGQEVRLWTPATRTELPALRHPARVTDLAFAPSGLLYTCATDGIVRAWDPARGTAESHFSVPGGPLSGISLSPDGRLLATAQLRGQVRLWKMAPTPELVRSLAVPEAKRPLRFASDGRLLVARTQAGMVMWQLSSNHPSQLEPYTRVVRAVAFTPDDKTLAIGGQDGVIHLYSLAAKQEVGSIPALSGAADSLAFSQDGLLAAGGSDGYVRLWRIDGPAVNPEPNFDPLPLQRSQ